MRGKTTSGLGLILCSAFFLGCGGGGGGEASLTGTWTGTLTSVSVSACGGVDGQVSDFSLQITQNGSQLSARDPDPDPLSGSVAGDHVSLSRTQMVTTLGCTETANFRLEGTLSADRLQLAGTITVMFTYVPTGCRAPCTSTFTFSVHR